MSPPPPDIRAASLLRIAVVPCTRFPRPLWAVAILALWLAAIAAHAALHRSGHPVAGLCNFKRLTSLPCPTCGGTRASLAILAGQPLSALALNPLITLGGTALLILFLMRLFFARSLQIRASARGWTALAGIVILLLALNWIYLIGRGI